MRREVLQFFADRSSRQAGLDQLIEHLTERRAAGEPPMERDRIALQLHHVHLPKLADIGVIEYDSDTDNLRYHPDDDLERYLEITQRDA